MCVSVYISQLDQPPENFIRNIDFANVFDLYYPSLYSVTILHIYIRESINLQYHFLPGGRGVRSERETEIPNTAYRRAYYIHLVHFIIHIPPHCIPPPRHVRPKSTIIALAPIYQKIYHALCGGCYVENDGDQSETTMVTIRTKLTKNTSPIVAWDALKIYQLFTTLTDT
uniref:Uncharacterized protein n=1 Tax=Phlebotomus papatasi TaxID=29031 RepID=A0A1B0GMJ8_PHLPP